MTYSIPTPRPLFSRRALASTTLALLLTAGFASQASQADPEDFQAMPGLWKTDTTTVRHGHPGKPVTKWHCFLEQSDPWDEFASLTLPGAKCTRSDEQRTSTSLSWTMNCTGKQPAGLTGRVDFDSTEHYIATVTTGDHKELVHVEGIRRAACTDPSD